MVLTGVLGADLDGGAEFALHPAGDVVAAVDGIDRVGVVDCHRGVALHVGHSAAAADVALHHRSAVRLGVDLRYVVPDGQCGADGLSGAVGVGHLAGEGDDFGRDGRVGKGEVAPVAVGDDGQIARGARVEAVFHRSHRGVLGCGRGACVVACDGGAIEEPLAGLGHTGLAEALLGAHLIVEVHTATVQLLDIFGVGRGGHHADVVGGCVVDGGYHAERSAGGAVFHHLALEGVAAGGQARQAHARGDGGDVLLVHLFLHRQEGGRITGREVGSVHLYVVVVGNRGVGGVAAGAVGTVVVVDHLFGALVAVHCRHAPLCRGGTLAGGIVEGVVDEPVVGGLPRTAQAHSVLDGEAVVPVVPDDALGHRLVRHDAVHAQSLGGAGHEVVAVGDAAGTEPLLVVVAGAAGAVPHAEFREVVVLHADNPRVGRVGGVEGEIDVALLHDFGRSVGVAGMGAEGVDFGPALGLVVTRQVAQALNVASVGHGVGHGAVKPVEVAVGQRVPSGLSPHLRHKGEEKQRE